MFPIGTSVDGRFEVQGLCSDSGGMGSLLYVGDLANRARSRQVLKYCKQTGIEAISRFKREVRLMKEFSGSQRVIQVQHANLDHSPPYFVMEEYVHGDLTKIAAQVASEPPPKEIFF